MGIKEEKGLGLGIDGSGSNTKKNVEKGIVSLLYDPSIYTFTRGRKKERK